MKKVKFQAVTGTRDFYPQNWAFQKWLFAKMREVSERFGYQEYEGPILEPLALYEAKSGKELVKKQTFILTDRGGKKLALRPELTPTLARMVAQKQEELVKPLRWFSIGRRWRYEKPQRGRTREFYQWDVDLIGVETPEADAEVIALACEFLKSLKLTPKEVKIKVNNRKLMDFKLSLIGIPAKKMNEVFSAIDKRPKMETVEWKKYLSEIGFDKLQIKDLTGILADFDFSDESEELVQVFSTLKDLGVKKYVEFDPNIVRGLDYYTGTVFEAVDTQGKFRSILGGGRYDNLVEVVGGKRLPGVGFAAGDVVLKAVLKEYNKLPKVEPKTAQVLITVFDESLYRNSLEVTKSLRKAEIPTELYLDPTAKLDKQLKYADRKGIPFVIIIGPEEVEAQEATLKNLQSRTQKRVPLNQLPKEIKL